jgi:predicted nucleotidyltransferase
MDVGRPYTALVPTLDGAVVTVLAGTTRRLTGREVARLTGRSAHKGVLDALNRMTEQGLVEREEAGRALLYTLNRDHLAAPAVEVLADMRVELRRRIRATLVSWAIPPLHASMFGSAARGDGDSTSDIDLFIVRSDDVNVEDDVWRAQLDDLTTRVRRWTGNRAAVSEVDEGELSALQRAERPIIDEMRNDTITLFGPNFEAMLAVMA